MRADRWIAGGALFVAGAFVPAVATADAWTTLAPVEPRSVERRISNGWLLTDQEAEYDPVLGRAATTPTVALLGGSRPLDSIGLRLGLPLGSGRWTVAATAGQDDRLGRTTRTASELNDLDGDGLADTLTWEERTGYAADARQRRRLGLRMGYRADGWGLGLWADARRDRLMQRSAGVAFPTTAATVGSGEMVTAVYDLSRQNRVFLESNRGQPFNEVQTSSYGLDFGTIGEAVDWAVALAWERHAAVDAVNGRQRIDVAGGTRTLDAASDLSLVEDVVATRLRFAGDGDLGEGRWRMLIGAVVEVPLALSAAGTETLESTLTGAGGQVSDAWIRETEVQENAGLSWELQSAIGVEGGDARLQWGGGLDARFFDRRRERQLRDRVRYRLDDPGVPGQRGRTFAFAEGYGDWQFARRDRGVESGAAVGLTAALTETFALLAGGRAAYVARSMVTQVRLIETGAVAGQSEQDLDGDNQTDVVDQLEIPYTAFDLHTGTEEILRETFLRGGTGLRFARDRFRFDLAALFGTDREAQLVAEAVVRW